MQTQLTVWGEPRAQRGRQQFQDRPRHSGGRRGALSILMVAAETSSGATWLPCPSQKWLDPIHFASQPSETLYGCPRPGSRDKAFLHPGTSALRPLGGDHDLEGQVESMIPIWAGLRFAMTTPCFYQSTWLPAVLAI